MAAARSLAQRRSNHRDAIDLDFLPAVPDWSERRYHLAGRVGAAICQHCLDIGWLTRERDTRAVRITAAGHRGLRNTFGVEF